MTERKVTVINSVGLHARPATYFIQKANSYKSSIQVKCGDRHANAKSLLGVLSIGIEKDSVVILEAEGIDENEAVEGLEKLILKGCNEE